MKHHPHVHCVVPAGGLSFDHQRWVRASPRYRFFLPKKVLSKVFRGKVRAALNDAFAKGEIGFYGKLEHPRRLLTRSWGILSSGLGGSLQTAIWRPRIGCPISRPLHSSNRREKSDGVWENGSSHIIITNRGALQLKSVFTPKGKP
jgi:hypothetical protein